MPAVWDWWKEQAHAWTPVGDASILLTGHFHHLAVIEQGPRLYLQSPPLDGGSDYFEHAHGYRSNAGTLTFTVGPNGWGNLTIL